MFLLAADSNDGIAGLILGLPYNRDLELSNIIKLLEINFCAI